MAPLTPGTALGGYEIVAPVGRGGMGEIYRARDPRRGREVAIKTLPARFAGHPELRPRFDREARAVAALSHPNILAFHDYGVDRGTVYLVTELLEGETLRQRLGRGPLALPEAVGAARAMAAGLAAAHDRGIIHRDFKPENLFLTREGRLKILDFGLAEIAVSHGGEPGGPPGSAGGPAAPGVLGTVEYMAPEQLRGLPPDPRSDLFSLGAVLYEVLSGRPAFRRGSGAATAKAVREEEPPPLDASQPPGHGGLEPILRRCLEKLPDRRYPSAREVAAALEASTGAASTLGDSAGPGRSG